MEHLIKHRNSPADISRTMNEGTRNLGESIRWPIIICLPHTPPSPAPPAAASDAAASDAAAAATAAQKGRHMPSLDAVSIILRGGGEMAAHWAGCGRQRAMGILVAGAAGDAEEEKEQEEEKEKERK